MLDFLQHINKIYTKFNINYVIFVLSHISNTVTNQEQQGFRDVILDSMGESGKEPKRGAVWKGASLMLQALTAESPITDTF